MAREEEVQGAERRPGGDGDISGLADIEAGEIGNRVKQRAAYQTARSFRHVLVSALIGGLDVGFAPLGAAFAITRLQPLIGPEAAVLAGALVYPIGFIFVVLGRSQLFTESTLVPAVAVLSGVAGPRWLARQWGIVLLGNLVGALVFAAIIANGGPLTHTYGNTIAHSANELLGYGFWPALFSGILAGWVMAILSWLLAAADTQLTRIVFVWLATFLIGAAPLHHSISGAAEVLFLVLTGGASWTQWFVGFQVPVTLGNAIGGVVMVGALKWVQARTTSQNNAFNG